MAEREASKPPASPAGSLRDEGVPADSNAAAGAPDLDRRLSDCLRLLDFAERDGQRRADEAADLRAKADERERLAAQLAAAEAERDALIRSTSWRITAPLRVLTERYGHTLPEMSDDVDLLSAKVFAHLEAMGFA